jgi:patatin-like phospholipase/acyl hydrolase
MFRILSVDGGGIKGVFPASFLAALEEDLPSPISAYFDLIAGTSTGGIIALGLGLGLTAKQLLDFYVSEGPSIFPPSSAAGWLRHWIAPKYSQEPLRTALNRAIGGKLLGDSSRRLLVPSLNAATGEIYIYKTRHHEELRTDWKVPAVEVALATSAAPSYFPVHASITNIPFIDGGIWANNPTGLAAVEAVTLLAQRPENVRILSLGCTYCPVDLRPRFAGKLGWARKALEAAMSGQEGGSLGTACMIVGHPNVIRVNPAVDSRLAALDRVRSIADLKGLGYGEARQRKPTLLPMFFSEAAPAFVPIP